MRSKNLLNFSLIFSVIAIFFLGFILNEDSAGGGKIDLIEHEWKNLIQFKDRPLHEALTSMSYASSRTPLFLIIHKYNIFIKDIIDLRITTFLFGILIFISYILCLKNLFKKEENSLVILIASLILLSPYLRSSVYWANQEHLSILFLILSLIFLYTSLEKGQNFEKNYREYYLFSFLSSFFAFLSFYSDQKLFFIAALLYFILIYKRSFYFSISFSIINFLFFIPAIYLFYLWGNIVPIESQSRLVNTVSNINIFVSNIGIYLLPFLIILIIKKNFKILFLKKTETLFLIFVLLVLFFTLPTNPSQEGSGIVFRLLSLMYLKQILPFEWQFFKFLYLFINILLFYLIIIFFKFSMKNVFIFLSMGTVYYLTFFTYQSYVDPIFLILIYTLFDMKNIDLTEPKLVYVSFVFYSMILANSLLFRLYII